MPRSTRAPRGLLADALAARFADRPTASGLLADALAARFADRPSASDLLADALSPCLAGRPADALAAAERRDGAARHTARRGLLLDWV